MLLEVPSTTVSAAAPAQGNRVRYALSICSTEDPHPQADSSPNIVCSMTWEGYSPGVSPSTSAITLGTTYDSSDGVAFGIYQNGKGMEGVHIDDSPF